MHWGCREQLTTGARIKRSASLCVQGGACGGTGRMGTGHEGTRGGTRREGASVDTGHEGVCGMRACVGAQGIKAHAMRTALAYVAALCARRVLQGAQ